MGITINACNLNLLNLKNVCEKRLKLSPEEIKVQKSQEFLIDTVNSKYTQGIYFRVIFARSKHRDS